ncbi:MAG: LLM class F420-dependent oxidoreductase, partial [Acidimicrobiales bacterium]
MRLGAGVGYTGDPKAAAERVKMLEAVGVDIVWVAELYSFDAPTLMGYLAAVTDRVQIGSSILPFYSRTPTLTAMTAAGLDALSDGRAILGLGASGPQVIEGWHGLPYDMPLQRTREVIEICRKVWRREIVEHDGKAYTLPLPADQGTGLGKPLKLINHPVRAEIPIYIASLGPKNVALTAEVANGWLPSFFWPDKAKDVFAESIDAGMA